jgi:hypothetical protein
VALVITDVSENILPSSSGFLRVIGPHSCVTVESLSITISIQGYYVGSKNTVFWDAFIVVSMLDVFWDLYRVALVRTDVSENISPQSSWLLNVRGYHSCVTVECLLISVSI